MKIRRILVRLVAFFLIISIPFVTLELALRAYKTMIYDGFLYLRTSSPNNRFHEKYGWIGPPGEVYEKSDDCYGRGTVTYNQQGFRAPDLEDLEMPEPVVCILGDSVMQGHQIPDGKHLPHLLQKALSETYPNSLVLPLAVGGYGTLQQWMLYKDFCEPLNPQVVIWHWSRNDPINNSFKAERNFIRDNSARKRPYFENGNIEYKKPYPIRTIDSIDWLMTTRAVNTVLLKFQSKLSSAESNDALEQGWSVADHFIGEIAKSTNASLIALLVRGEDRATDMFERHGYSIAIHQRIGEHLRCLPRDTHANQKGHEAMLDALLPVVSNVLSTRRLNN